MRSSKIHIGTIGRLPDYVDKGNIIGTLTVRTVKTGKKLFQRKFYSLASRKIMMNQVREANQFESFYFIISIDKIPEN